MELRTLYFKDTPEEALSFIPDFEYLLIDLQQFENKQLKAIRLAFLSNALLTFKNHRNNEFIISELSNMLSILPNETDRNFLRAFILYILTLVPLEQEEIIEITYKIPSHMSSEFISAAERLRQEGKKEGRQETLAKIILHMLQKENSVESIAQLLDIDVQFVQQVADQAKS